MRKISWPVLALALTLTVGFFASCSPGCALRGSGNVIEEQREVSDFNEVRLNGIGNLIIEMGDEESLRIEAEDNLLPHIVAEVSGETLTIEFKTGIRPDPTKPINYYVVAKELEAVGLSGSGTIEAGSLSAEEFTLSLNGSAKASIGDLTVELLRVSINGSGEVAIESVRAESLGASIRGSGSISIAGGKAEEQEIGIAGSGAYDAQEMESARAKARIAGSGDVVVRVSDFLKTEIAGSGTVQYVGKPKVELDISGSGTVKRIEG